MARPRSIPDRRKKTATIPETAETPEELLEVTQETAETPERPAVERFCCMDCGRILLPKSDKFTVKDRKNNVAVVCEICAQKKTIRLMVPYISYDAMRFLNIGKEWI